MVVRELTRTRGRARGPTDPRRDGTASLFEKLAGCGEALERKHIQDEVVVLNMVVARRIAGTFRNRGIDPRDLEQVAYVGLVKAVQGFDPAYERDFLSYAVPTITGEVKRHFRDFAWTVRPPRLIQDLHGQVRAAVGELMHTLRRSPTATEIADFLQIDLGSVVEAIAADGCYTPWSLDLPVGESSTTVGDLIEFEDTEFARADVRMLLGGVVRRLEPSDRRILELRFFHGWTQERIAADIGVTQMQISRRLARILNALRKDLS